MGGLGDAPHDLGRGEIGEFGPHECDHAADVGGREAGPPETGTQAGFIGSGVDRGAVGVRQAHDPPARGGHRHPRAVDRIRQRQPLGGHRSDGEHVVGEPRRSHDRAHPSPVPGIVGVQGIEGGVLSAVLSLVAAALIAGGGHDHDVLVHRGVAHRRAQSVLVDRGGGVDARRQRHVDHLNAGQVCGMSNGLGQGRNVAGLALALDVAGGWSCRGERRRGLTNRDQRDIGGHADHPVRSPWRRARHQRLCGAGVAGTLRGGRSRRRRPAGRRFCRRWRRLGRRCRRGHCRGRGDRRWRGKRWWRRVGRHARGRRGGPCSRRTRRGAVGRVGGRGADDRGDDGAVAFTIGQPAVG